MFATVQLTDIPDNFECLTTYAGESGAESLRSVLESERITAKCGRLAADPRIRIWVPSRKMKAARLILAGWRAGQLEAYESRGK